MEMESQGTVSNLFKNLERVLRLEVELFRAQWSEDLAAQKNSLVLIIVAIVFSLVGFTLLTIGFVNFLKATTSMPGWACEMVSACPFLVVSAVIFLRRNKWRALSTLSQKN